MKELLQACARIERAVSDLYFSFREIHHESDPELAALWEKTAQEELNHEQQFLMAERLYAAQLDPNPSVTLESLQKVLQSIETVQQKARELRPNAQQALKMAVGLEEQLAETHMQAVMRFTDQSVTRLFAAMMAADQDHVASLRQRLAACLEQA